MQVILQEDIVTLGKAGEVVNVKEGFGRNYLLPSHKAVLADPKNLKQLEHQKRVAELKQAKLKKTMEELSQKIAGLALTISRESGEEDKLFGSVTVKDIADALRAEGVTIDRHGIVLAEPIKQLGIFDVPVRLSAGVTASVKVWVVKKTSG